MFISIPYKGHLGAFNLFQSLASKVRLHQKTQTILVVEDDEDCSLLLKCFLKSLPYKTITKTTGEAAIKYLAKHSDEVVLIISDIGLPGMSGLEFISKLKVNSCLKQIPIIIQSAFCDGSIQEGMVMGASGYVQKPYTKEALYAAIKKLNIK